MQRTVLRLRLPVSLFLALIVSQEPSALLRKYVSQSSCYQFSLTLWLVPTWADPTHKITQQILCRLGYSSRGWRASNNQPFGSTRILLSFKHCTDARYTARFTRKAESSNKYDIGAWYVGIGTHNLQRGSYFPVLVTHYPIFILRSRTVVSFLKNSWNSRNFSSSKYSVSFLCHYNLQYM